MNVGPITGGGSVTITFQVIIDLPLSAGVKQVSNQGWIHGNSFETEPTDDPDTPLIDDDPTVTPVLGVAIDPARKTDSLLVDAWPVGMVSPGDIILYEVTFWNTGNMDATGVIYTDVPDPNTDFIVGTVTCDKAGSSVITDTSNLVVVDVGTVQGEGLERVTVTIQARIHKPFPRGVHSVYNQAVIHSNEESPVSTDDPITPAAGDPTETSMELYFGRAVPVFPNLYVGIAAALGAGILAFFLRRRLIHRE